MQRLPVLILLAACAGPIAAKEPAPSSAKGVVVHEWGVFRVSEDADFANGQAIGRTEVFGA